jgi:exopolyphosphatase / guanosine-5'-triphosphate,3'-diphosphate pyrophosphatase
MKRPRLAAIDIGTNSIRCIVVEMDKQGTCRVLDDEKATVRLGEGLSLDNRITGPAWERAMTALARMKKIIDGYGVVGVEAVATSAVRRAGNGLDFVKEVASSVGLEISIISGEEEAALAILSAQHNFDMTGKRYALVDIGGGSVEIVTALGPHVEEIYSLDLGAVVLTENFITTDPVSNSDYLKLRKHLRKCIKAACPDRLPPAQFLIGSGGTMTSIAAMVMAMRKEEYGSVHGHEVLRSEVVHLLAMLVRKDLKGLKAVPGLNPDRSDIIVAGVTAVDELMDFFGANMLKINERGLREGLILKAIKKFGLLPAERKSRSWRESVLEFARSCHFDEEHSLQIVKLALVIFDAVAAPFALAAIDRQMLEAAALLHDVGYFISYAGHHKHTYHLIRHADLFGFTPREREIIANIARYHRKSLPKKKHESFERLSPQDKELVRRLGGIVRLADGLDRRRNSVVYSLECTLSSGSFQVRLHGDDDLSVELFGGKIKGDLFEQAFGRKLSLTAAATAAN